MTTGLAPADRAAGLEPDRGRSETSHRVVCVYATSLRTTKGGESVASLFGPRFELHYRRVEDVMPRVLPPQDFRGEEVDLPDPLADLTVECARAQAFAPVRGRLVVALTIDFAAPSLRDAVPLLDVTCHERADVRLRGEHVVLAAYPDACGEAPEPLYEADVHQILMPARADRSLTHGCDEDVQRLLQSLVVRAPDPTNKEPSYRRPPDLNMCDGEVAAIKSGVSVLLTKTADVETAATVSAVQLLASMSELRRIRRDASEALEEFEASRNSEPSGRRRDELEHRESLTQLSGRLEELQLGLAFGVETYTNMRLLVPQHLVYQYHGALAQSLDMPEGVAATERMLSRLHEVVGATRESVAAKERQRDDMLHRRWAVAAAGAIPLTLLFSFLGINTSELTEERHSLFDVGHFGVWYLALLVAIVLGLLLLVLAERRR
jgi:hypothetical protein